MGTPCIASDTEEPNMKILVVDDSRAMRRIVSRTIRQAGYEGHDIVEAENGREALEVTKAEKPDLILSDWHMPEMTGIEFLRGLNAEGIEIPFGFVTSESTAEMVEAATEAGALFLLAKPFTAEDMGQVLGAFIS
jgi:two-component system chemotaxis response regulator CheY